MSQPLVLVDRTTSALTIITLNRPEKRNALNIDLLNELCTAIETTEQMHEQRVVIFTGAGTIFCAGMDLKDAADPLKIELSAELLAKLFKTIYQSRLISIAAIQGSAIAGGAGLASACDLAIASDNAEFGYPEVRRGLVAAQVSALLRRLISQRYVRELLLTGELISAGRAKEIGLINYVVKLPELMKTALQMTETLLKGTPKAVEETKKLLIDLELISLEDDLKMAMDAHRRARFSDEAKERINHFFGDSK